ncbi:MAG: F0F1 ATP synthase subunit A [Pyrinomonadaceae bacterium]|nr:F0F1 ATP synthase subunit A [Pyrinomonadaceae bacterium]
MFWLLETAKAAEHGQNAEQAAHHTPIIVELVNHYFGQAAYEFQIRHTYPRWKTLFAKFHTTPEAVFGPYSPETAIPWYSVMFVIACILSVTIIWILKGKLSTEEPGPGQQTLEVGVLAVRDMLADIVGPQGLKYFPIVMTFAVLILVSNLMGLFPLFMSPTAATSVTFALGLTSFFYYNYVGIAENGILGHLKHLAGPIWWISFLIFPIEVISNLIRPFSLGIRLFGNIFADEQVSSTVAGIFPPITQWLVPVPLMVLGVFVAFVQTFVFILLSQLYLSEVSHAPHEEHDEHGEHEIGGQASLDQHEAIAVS